MSLAVSVVVPFFNPGANIVDCLDSLLGQTLPRDQYEIVLVDDGSTDGSPERVERVRARHPDLIRIERIPASGWAGAPRNRGVDCARGEYVQFVDADDSLHPRALERLLAVATSSGADIVIGKLSSDFRTLNHPIYRHTLTGLTIRTFPLVESLTPHKMFRRAMLIENGIRFAEGPRHVEDEHFCIQAYTSARSVAIVGDLNCYFYNRRRSAGRNLGDTVAIPAEYYRDLASILDVIDRKVADPDERIEIQRRFYRVEMLGRLRGRPMLNYSAAYRDEVLREVQALATSRFAPAVRSGLPFFIRAQSHLMLTGDTDGLMGYAAWLESIRLRATTAAPRWADGRLHIDIDAALYVDDEPLRLERVGDRWALPEAAAATDMADRLVNDSDLAAADVDCATVSRADASQWSTTAGLALTIRPDGTIGIGGSVVIDPQTVAGGGPLSAGLWDLRLRVMVGGLTRSSPLRSAEDAPVPLPAWVAPDGDRCVAAYWTEPNPTVALDVDEWSHPLHELVADSPAVEMRPRRWLEIDVPAIAGGPARRAAAIVLEPAEPTGTAVICDAQLVVTPAGSRLRARLPRGHLPGTRWRLWARIGRPGGPPPRALRIELGRERRRYRMSEIG